MEVVNPVLFRYEQDDIFVDWLRSPVKILQDTV